MTKYHLRWKTAYEAKLAVNGFTADPAQVAIIHEFARIEDQMSSAETVKSPSSGLLSRFLTKAQPAQDKVKGLYLFGTVGRGKTFLMDLFCEYIGFSVRRLHFHHFMKSIHDELKRINNEQNPLTILAADFAQQYRILCLDEFMVTDITDAMLLYGLLKNLIDKGVVVITTTNIPPDDLYKEGLQRQRFLPAIDLIKSHLVIHEIAAGQDFRRLFLSQHQRYFSPHNRTTQQALQQIADKLNQGLMVEKKGNIVINQRDIPYIEKSQQMIWFHFKDLCEGYRSQLDYIELAKQFKVMIVSEIPVLDAYQEESARRFLLLIDELYDQRIDLILSSVVPIETIYTGNKIHFEFERLQSRLFEMQSDDYAHR